MSDTGLYSGLYTAVKKLAELVDIVILDLKSESSTPTSIQQRQHLGTLLSNLQGNPREDVTTSLLSIILRDSPRSFDPKDLGGRLLTGKADPATVDRLETLASILDSERSTVWSKMRGQR